MGPLRCVGFLSITIRVFGSLIRSVCSNVFCVIVFLLLDMFMPTLICLHDARIVHLLCLEIDWRVQREVAQADVTEATSWVI